MTPLKIRAHIHEFLSSRNFLEHFPATLSSVPCGAAATPFVTESSELGKLNLIIAPEIQLKLCLIEDNCRHNGVYSICNVFRNEGVDRTHYPEFSMCEFYQIYQDYLGLISVTEELLSSMVLAILNTYKHEYHTDDLQTISIDFQPPYKQIYVIPELEKEMNCKLPVPGDLHTEESRIFLSDLCDKFDVSCSAPRTSARLVDKLIGKFIEPKCIQPTFLLEHPLIMSPLAKEHPTKPGLSARFELFVAATEIMNAYSELTDPVEQRQRFVQQSSDRKEGDGEAQVLDENFIAALDLGMSPAAGCGIGIERLAMLLTNSSNIKEVIRHPVTKS